MALVLIHGSHLTNSCWEDLLPHLTAPVLAVDLPGRKNKKTHAEFLRFSDLADSVVADMDAAGIVKAILVGHSLAGETLRALALRHPERIEHLVFVSALVLRKGECPCDVLSEVPQAGLLELRKQQQRMFVNPPELATATAADLNEQQLNTLLQALVPDALSLFFECVTEAEWPSDIPCTYIKLLDDLVFSDGMQNAFANALPSPAVVALQAGHFAMFNKPKELAELLNTIIG